MFDNRKIGQVTKNFRMRVLLLCTYFNNFLVEKKNQLPILNLLKFGVVMCEL